LLRVRNRAGQAGGVTADFVMPFTAPSVFATVRRREDVPRRPKSRRG